MKLTFVIHSLESGGAERVMSIMASHFAEWGREVCLVTLDDGSEPPFFPLHERVAWQPLGVASLSSSLRARLWNAPKRAWTLRRRIRTNQPDAVVSFMDRTNCLTLIATAGMRAPVIVSERNDPAQHNVASLFDAVRKILYRRAHAIVVQTNAAASYFGPPLRAKTIVIPNPVPPPPKRASGELRSGNQLMAMGRLCEAKGFDLLLRAFAAVADQHPDWNLTIWGEGLQRGQLERLRDDLGLAERARLPGRTRTPAAEMQRADIFVLSSRYEGFPNVLVEAMACGAAAISFACPSGPAGIIEHGVNGVLVPPRDVSALAGAIAALMSDEAERRRLGANAERVTEAFSLQRVMGMWQDVIDVNLNRVKGMTPCAE